MIQPILWIIFAYLLGSIPVGLVLSKLKGRDPRTTGSGNIGATNVMRTAGKTLGIITLLGDVAKGFLPVWLAARYGQPTLVVAVVGIAAFIGHIFPLYLRFKGGKGVATAVGVFLAVSPLSVLIVVVLFVVLLIIFRYVSLGSLAGTALTPIVLYLLKVSPHFITMAVIMVVLIFWKHRENIKRLWQGTENKVFSRK